MLRSLARVFTKSFAILGSRDMMLVFRLVIDDIRSSADISPSLKPICSDWNAVVKLADAKSSCLVNSPIPRLSQIFLPANAVCSLPTVSLATVSIAARPSAELKSIDEKLRSRSFLPALIAIALIIASTASSSNPDADN